MRLMEQIRRKGQLGLVIFLGFFIVSIFAGLGVGMFGFRGCDQVAGQQQVQKPQERRLVDDMGEALIRVNGREVSEKRYFELYGLISQNVRGNDDPGVWLDVYGVTMAQLVHEEIVLAQGEELDVKVTGADVAEERELILQRYMGEAQQQATGNILGDIAKGLGGARERRAAFNEYLETNGLTEEIWEQRVRRDLLERKTMEKLQELADAEQALKAAETRAIIDQKLKEGATVAELAREYSDASSAANDGDLGTWVGRMVFHDDIVDQVFATPTGEITEWLEIPAGWQRFEIYDRKEAKGEEFEASRQTLIDNIKGEKGEDYEPTEEEIAQRFEQLKVRELMVKSQVPGAAQEEIAELSKQAVVEVNEPYALAYQALKDVKLTPPLSMSFEDLVTIAENAPVGEDYDYSLIQDKLDEGRPAPPPEAEETTESGEAAADDDTEGAESPEASDTEDTPEAEADVEATDTEELDIEWPEGEPGAPPAEETEPVPIYALGFGLMKAAIQDESDPVPYFAYYILAKTLYDWLEDEEQNTAQPANRADARQLIEDYFALAAERYEYGAAIHAYRGLNLAWLERPEEAREALALGQKYALKEVGGIWDVLKEGYEVLEDEEKVKQIDDIQAAIRQEELKRAIEQQAQEKGQPSPFTVDITPEGEETGEESPTESADEGEAEETGEPADATEPVEADEAEAGESTTEENEPE